MSKYYLKETRTYRDEELHETSYISLFVLDFDNNRYQWVITRNEKPNEPSKEYTNMMDGLISHVSYITHKNKDGSCLNYKLDIITKDEAEELMFLLGI